MLHNKKIIWANYIGEAYDSNLFFCFPSQYATKILFEKKDVNFLVERLPPFYELLINAISDAGQKILPEKIPSLVYGVLLREPIVLMTYALLDRIFRLNVAVIENNNLAVGAKYMSRPKVGMGLTALIDGSQTYNQYLLSRLSSDIWNLPVCNFDKEVLPDARGKSQVQNFNFDSPGLSQRINRKAIKLISKIFGRVPALRLANIDSSLLDHGLYGCGKLKWMSDKNPPGFYVEDLEARKLLVEAICLQVEVGMTDIYFHMGVSDIQVRSRIARVFCELLIESIPPNRLEGAHNYRFYENELDKKRPPAIFFCGMPSQIDIFVLAAARLLSVPIIGVQHGVHYGFVEQPCFSELEFAYCDRFITWGWTKYIKNSLGYGVKTLPLPSPWLSTRINQWKGLRRLSVGDRYTRNHDVLFMLDRIQVYPTTVNTLRLSRVDFLTHINASCSKIFSNLINRDVRILVKPFNYTSREAQRDLMIHFESNYPGKFSEYKKLDKGLTRELLGVAWMIVWDEPGTGFFECLLAGIPAMVYWDRHTSKEESHARQMFLELQSVGVLHTDPVSITEEVSNFLRNPDAWLLDESRVFAIKRIVDNFSRVDSDWVSDWRSFLDSI